MSAFQVSERGTFLTTALSQKPSSDNRSPSLGSRQALLPTPQTGAHRAREVGDCQPAGASARYGWPRSPASARVSTLVANVEDTTTFTPRCRMPSSSVLATRSI